MQKFSSIHVCMFECNCCLGLVYLEGSRFRMSFYLQSLVVAATVDAVNGLALHTSIERQSVATVILDFAVTYTHTHLSCLFSFLILVKT